jgi:DNA gyrase subunit B
MLLRKKISSYDSSSVQILDLMDAIRKRVSLYLGSSDSDAIFRMVGEVIDNSVDESTEGYNNYIGIIINSNGEIIVADKGRGIPVSIHAKSGQPTIVDVFTKLHAGGKFGSQAYSKGSIGVHGIGVKATNALSKKLEVWSYQNNRWWNVGFEKGKLVTKLNKTVKLPSLPFKLEKGTVVRFTPNLSYFDKDSKLSIKHIKDHCDFLSYLHAGLKIFLQTPKNEYTFYQKDGLSALLDRQLEEFPDIETFGKPFVLSKDRIDMAVVWTTYNEELVNSYVSGMHTTEGGSHITGLYDAIRESIKPYKGKTDFSPADVRVGLIGTINVSVTEPKFSSQSKSKLVMENITKEVFDIVKPALDEYFLNNKSMVKKIILKATELSKLKAKYQADKKSIAALKSKAGKALLASKLSKSFTKDPLKRELFIAEGDGACGSLTLGRDREYQETLPLRGKILNAYTADQSKLLGNNEVQDILRSIGCDLSLKDPTAKLRVGKIIIFTDPDHDGRHIENLLLSLFQKVLPESFIRKKIFIVDSPLFNTQLSNGNRIYGKSVDEVMGKLNKINKKLPKEGVQRLKGWGETTVAVLKEIALNKETRKLCRVQPLKNDEIVSFANIVGESPVERRKLLGL